MSIRNSADIDRTPEPRAPFDAWAIAVALVFVLLIVARVLAQA